MKKQIINEGDLIPMPANTFWIPGDEYEFYKLLQQLANHQDDQPVGGLYKQDADSVIVCTPQEVERMKKLLKKLNIPYDFGQYNKKFRFADFRGM